MYNNEPQYFNPQAKLDKETSPQKRVSQILSVDIFKDGSTTETISIKKSVCAVPVLLIFRVSIALD